MTADKDETLRSLLLAMLAPIRRMRETPLQFEIDSRKIVEAALSQCPEAAEDLGEGPDSLIESLDRMTGRAIGRGGDRPPEPPLRLAAWLDGFFSAMRELDPRAIEITGLRLEGFGDREIAERMETGLRLVKRIRREISSLEGAGAC